MRKIGFENTEEITNIKLQFCQSELQIITSYGLVGFYGISTIVGYLMPNPTYRYILNIWFVNIL